MSMAGWWARWWASRLARRAARGAVYGGGGAGLLWAFGYGVVRGEATLARRGIHPPETTPIPAGRYGSDEPGRPPLRMAVLGDSSAAGTGCADAAQTPGVLAAVALAAETGRPVDLDVLAVVGSLSSDLEPQVARALLHPPDLALISIGANDVTHAVAIPTAVGALTEAVERLRAAGVNVVVNTCPDLGAVTPIRQPLRTLAHLRSKRMSAAQQRAVVAAGGVPVALGEKLGKVFRDDPALFCQDRFHPSAAGYVLIVDELMPAVRAAAGSRARTEDDDGGDTERRSTATR